MGDPMEALIRNALCHAEEPYQEDCRLDFYLPKRKVFIEVKQFHSPRITAQMASQPDVIAAQGRLAVEFLAQLIKGSNNA
jgi:DNA-binding sugar fermentation-stimulating protein